MTVLWFGLRYMGVSPVFAIRVIVDQRHELVEHIDYHVTVNSSYSTNIRCRWL